MAVLFSYNLTGHVSIDNNHIQSMFERFGWASVGGSSYRFPPLDAVPSAEDWLNTTDPRLLAQVGDVCDKRAWHTGSTRRDSAA